MAINDIVFSDFANDAKQKAAVQADIAKDPANLLLQKQLAAQVTPEERVVLIAEHLGEAEVPGVDKTGANETQTTLETKLRAEFISRLTNEIQKDPSKIGYASANTSLDVANLLNAELFSSSEEMTRFEAVAFPASPPKVPTILQDLLSDATVVSAFGGTTTLGLLYDAEIRNDPKRMGYAKAAKAAADDVRSQGGQEAEAKVASDNAVISLLTGPVVIKTFLGITRWQQLIGISTEPPRAALPMAPNVVEAADVEASGFVVGGAALGG